MIQMLHMNVALFISDSIRRIRSSSRRRAFEGSFHPSSSEASRYRDKRVPPPLARGLSECESWGIRAGFTPLRRGPCARSWPVYRYFRALSQEVYPITSFHELSFPTSADARSATFRLQFPAVDFPARVDDE
uniref:Uncharacterized protein n=1 Tax=Candidatus Kentrum sp. TC TaxID=2126339 RepID=A0A450ZS84_9GAMM|nr:MAG: hypothetical protein BECKTC1821F_GA0114240_101132 [Candidatus Kentron sp. TC]